MRRSAIDDLRLTILALGMLGGIAMPASAWAWGGSTSCKGGGVGGGQVTVPFKFDTRPGGHGSMTPDLNDMGSPLANNLNYQAVLIANRWVSTASFHFTTFNIPSTNGDTLTYHADRDYPLTGNSISSTPALPGVTPLVSWSVGMQVLTDDALTSAGFAIDTATVTCLDMPHDPEFTWPIGPGLPAIGMLLGDGDTLFFEYTQAPFAVPKAQNRLHVALNTSNSVDFNLYARCDALPSASSYTDAGLASSPTEFLDLPLSSCPSGHWFFAVDSVRGAGDFNISVGEGADFAFCVTFDETIPFTTAEKDTNSDNFMIAMKAFYQANLGGPLFTRVGFTDNGTSGACNINGSFVSPFAQFSKNCSQSITSWTSNNTPIPDFTSLCTDSLAGFPNTFTWKVPFHEMGHLFWGFPDEYDVPGKKGAMCGHSVYGNPLFFGYCPQHNHAKDKRTGAPNYTEPQAGLPLRGPLPYGDNVAMEQKIRTAGPTTQIPEPRMSHELDLENYSLTDFDFNASHPNTVMKIVSYQ